MVKSYEERMKEMIDSTFELWGREGDAISLAKEADTQLTEKAKEIERLKLEIECDDRNACNSFDLIHKLGEEIDRIREQFGNIEQLKADAIDEMVKSLMDDKHECNILLINDIAEYADNLRKNTELKR